MNRPFLLTCSVASTALLVPHHHADAAVTVYAAYRLGEAGTVGPSNEPLDSVGTRHIDTVIAPSSVFVGAPGAVAGSTAFLDTSHPGNAGYYHPGNFSDLPSNNFAIGVYARASSLDAANRGTIFGTGDGGFDISLQANGWAGSIFNVAWVGQPDGVSGSFIPDTWVHLALIRADGVSTFYIDGVAQPGSSAAPVTNALPHVSVSPGGFTYFDGGIDEIRVVTFDQGESTSAVLGALTTIPEPSSLGLLAAGVTVFLRRRR